MKYSLQNILINLSRFQKKLLLVFFDSIFVVIILIASFSIRFGYWYVPQNDLFWLIFGSPIIAIPIFFHFGMYRAIVRYFGFNSLWSLAKALTFYAILWGLLTFMTSIELIPRSVILINWLLGIISIGGYRMLGRWFLSWSQSDSVINVIIYGAGSAGRQLSIALTQSSEYMPVAFIDDNSELHRQSINGIEIFSKQDIDKIIHQKKATEILLAMPTISNSERSEIINFLESFPLLVRSLPGVSELAQGKVKIADLREISIKDLLGRNFVEPNKELLSLNIKKKVVLVTGAGGSIGSEICRQVLFLKPQTLILFEQNEYALYSIDKELSLISKSSISIVPVIGSISNMVRLNNIIENFNVQTIYHAAAYKHVPMVEFNNAEGVSNNIIGTLNCVEASIKNKVETFVLISTDKAVRPTNTMGATKRFAEMILQAKNLSEKAKSYQNKGQSHKIDEANTKFSIVRFGNVLDSSGSVIPLFKEQIKRGGPITVTDPEIFRYFMSIPEAVELVIQAGAMSKGGDVFVLDMGEPVRILDLAKKMIRLSGLKIKDKLNPDGDIEIKFTGLRPGEKIKEELLIGDNVSETSNPMIMSADESMLSWNDLKPIIDELKLVINMNDSKKLRALLIQAIPEFSPQGDIADILHDTESN